MSHNQGDSGMDWGNEIAHALKLIGRVILKIFSSVLNILLTLLLIGIICGVIVGGAFALYIKNYVDTGIDEFELMVGDQNMTTKIYYMDYTDRVNRIGTPVEIEEERIYSGENRIWASYSSMPNYLIEAFVSIEDERFWTHSGVDWKRTIGATLSYFTGGKRYGGSTITQQLIKNITGDNEVKIQRKIQEIFRALNLEKTLDKTQIIELYLNTISLSQKCYGVQAASHKYFNKDVSELTLVECAALAAIPKAPTSYDPIQNPEKNKQRRDTVLMKMHELGKITDEEYQTALNTELVLDVQTENLSADQSTTIRSWYADAAFTEATELLMEQLGVTKIRAQQLIYSGGLSIYTAMDPDVQDTMEAYFEEQSNFEAIDDSIIQPQCSMVILDAQTSDVLGIVGGRGEKTANLTLNYATDTQRSPGSSIKPVSVYAPALEMGIITYGSVYDDSPFNFGTEVQNEDGTTSYTRPYGYPVNYPAGYRGLTTIHDAISRSVNTVAMKVLDDLGLQTSYNFVYDKLKMHSVIDRMELPGGTVLTDIDYSALALGGMNYGVTVMEITAAYGIFANEGIYSKPRIVLKILDSEGNVIVNNVEETEIVISSQSATIMTKMLENVLKVGTGSKMTIKNIVDVAGKTGTTSDDNDRWFVGYTPYYIGGVWFGYEIPKSLNNFSASPSPAAKTFDDIMNTLHQKIINEAIEEGTAIRTFEDADGVIQATYCRDSGKLITDACKADPRGSRAEVGYFTRDTVPTEECDCHVLVDYDAVTGAIACPTCPKENIIQVGLLNIERSFSCQVIITDAQYVYRSINLKMTDPVLEPTSAFYANLLDGKYAGVSSYSTQYNRYCSEHYVPGYTGETDDPFRYEDEDETDDSLYPWDDFDDEEHPEISVPDTTVPETDKTVETVPFWWGLYASDRYKAVI